MKSSDHRRDDLIPAYYRPSPELYGCLKAEDFEPNSVVYVEFEDGSSCRFRHAFVRGEGDWYVVYTEHCGYHVYPKKGVSISGREAE